MKNCCGNLISNGGADDFASVPCKGDTKPYVGKFFLLLAGSYPVHRKK